MALRSRFKSLRNPCHPDDPHGSLGCRRGFTLIEVLISVVILSTGIVVVLQGLHSSLSAMDASVEKTRSAILLRSKIVESQALALDGVAPTTLPPRGVFSSPYDDYLWQLDVIPKTSPGGDPVSGSNPGSFFEVGVSVWRKGSERQYSVSTLIYVAVPDEEPPLGANS